MGNGKDTPRHLSFQAEQTENKLSDTRLILPNYPKLFQQPPPACLPPSYHTRLFAHGFAAL